MYERRRILFESSESSGESWEYPVQTGDTLSVTQAYSVEVNDGTAVIE